MSVMMGYNGGGPGGGGGGGGGVGGVPPPPDILFQETDCGLPPFKDPGYGLSACQDGGCGLPPYQEGGCGLPPHGLADHGLHHPPTAHGLDYSSDVDPLASCSSHHHHRHPYTPAPEPPLDFAPQAPDFDRSNNNNNNGGSGVGGQAVDGRPRRRRRTPPTKIDINDNSLYSVYCFFKSLLSASTASTVAIDNKIEQAMDLVKSHLMFAVREEVEVLKEKITELMERISQLEYENTVLRQYATQEALQQIQQPHHTSNT